MNSLSKIFDTIISHIKTNKRYYGEIIIKFQNGKPVLLSYNNQTIRVDELNQPEIKHEVATIRDHE